MSTIAVIDYGMGNLRSVARALEHVARGDQRVAVTSDAATIRGAERVVFPGQGAIRDCMAELAARGLTETVLEVATDRPFLGICMGLQALMETSEECRDTPGLGILAGGVPRFSADQLDPRTGERLKVPHMGWNQVHFRAEHPLWAKISDRERFYFVHSYYVDPVDPDVVAATTEYGLEFTCAVARESLFAVQFHPEKSQHAGLTLLGNFARWRP